MHSIGFFHEQSRPDRDSYIDVIWDNIQRGADSQFEKYSTRRVTTLGEDYDYGSIMHYSSRAFTRNGQSTIRAKRSGVSLGQRNGFSSLDLAKVNKLYQCDGQTGGVATTRRPSVTNRPNPNTGDCEDERFDCGLMARFTNMCDGRGSRFSSMQNECRASCGLCREQTTRRPAATTRRPSTSCTDQRSDCSFLDMFFDYCTDSRRESQMRAQCAGTCGFCSNTRNGSSNNGRGSNCADSSGMCRVAVMMDLCGSLRSTCPETCGLC